MKIEGPRKSGAAKGPSKSGKGQGAGTASFGDFIAKETPNAPAAAGTQSINHVDALLALQGAQDPAQGRAKQQMRKRANIILDELDQIRNSMLNGTLTIGQMIDIADVVASHREKIMDVKLTAIMDEIDLRAQVELAKLRVAASLPTSKATAQT